MWTAETVDLNGPDRRRAGRFVQSGRTSFLPVPVLRTSTTGRTVTFLSDSVIGADVYRAVAEGLPRPASSPSRMPSLPVPSATLSRRRRPAPSLAHQPRRGAPLQASRPLDPA